MLRLWRSRMLFCGIIAVLAAAVAGISWTLASPLGASPDDDFHLASIWCPSPYTADGCNPKPDPETGKISVETPRSILVATCFAFNKEASAGCQLALDDPSRGRTIRFDQGDYPGGFYDVMHLFVQKDVERSVFLMRLFNVLLAVGLLAGVIATMNQAGRRVAVIAMMASIVPLGMFILASINPGSWAITGVSVAWLGVYSLFTATTRKRTIAAGIFALAGACLAAVSRADAGVYVLIGVGAVGLLYLTQIKLLWRKFIFAAIVGLIGVAGFLSAGQAGTIQKELESQKQGGGLSLLLQNIVDLPSLYSGLFGLGGGLGWLDTPMKPITWFPAFMVASWLIFAGLKKMDGWKALAMIGIVGVLMALPLLVLQAGGMRVGSDVQPRYLLPLLPLLIGIGLIGKKRDTSAMFSRAQLGVMAIGLSVANCIALHQNIRRYTTGLDYSAMNLNKKVEWWWSFGSSPMVVWVVGSVAFALMTMPLFCNGLSDDGRKLVAVEKVEEVKAIENEEVAEINTFQRTDTSN